MGLVSSGCPSAPKASVRAVGGVVERSDRAGAVLDADLLTQKRDLVPEALKLGPEAKAGVEALSGPAKSGGQGDVGEGDGVHSRRTNATGPASGKRKGTGDTGDGQPPREWQG